MMIADCPGSGGFQWPPQKREEGSGTPTWNVRPNSRNSSPAPRNMSPAVNGPSRESPLNKPIVQQQQAKPQQSQQFQQPQPQQQQQNIMQQQTTMQQQQNVIQQQQQSVIQQQQKQQNQSQNQQNWAPTLAANNAGAADNAADFTRNFLSQLAGPPAQNGARTTPGNGHAAVAPAPPANSLHNPAPEAPAAGPGQNVSAPKRGRGVLQQQQHGMRVPVCGGCQAPIK